jgi:type I restriction enzyme S subunit
VTEWAELRLGDAVTLQRGFDLPSSKRDSGKFPIISSSGKSGTHSEPAVAGPGVVTGRYGTIGKVFYIEEDFWPLNTTLFVKDFKGNDPRFVYYLLQPIDFLSFSDKTSVPGVNRNHLHLAPILLPPLPEQRAIAHILGTLDDKIELNRRMNETLEEMARALFKSWFVDFDPVRAKAEGRQPSGMDAATAALFPDSFEDSELGPIPAGWKAGRFSDGVELIGGGTPKTSVEEYWNGDIPWFSVVDAPTETDVWVLDTEKKISQLGLQSSSTRMLEVGTSIVSARGTVGRIALVGRPMAMNQSCYAIRGAKGYPPFYTFYQLRNAVQDLQQRSHGTVFETITRQTFETTDVVLPSVKAALAFDETASLFLQPVRSNLRESQALGAIRNSLLPKLLSGEIRVREAEKLMEAAAT